MRTKRLLWTLIALAVVVGAYGFWWWRVQEMDATRCASAIVGMGAAENDDGRWTYTRGGDAPPWEERKYRKEGVTLADIIMHEYVDRYCERPSGILWP